MKHLLILVTIMLIGVGNTYVVPHNTCDPLQCGFFSARRCLTHGAVAMSAWVDNPEILPSPTCIAMCGDGTTYSDVCSNNPSPPIERPPSLPDCTLPDPCTQDGGCLCDDCPACPGVPAWIP